MNQEAASNFLAGTAANWLGVDPKKPKKGERDILNTFGERVMLAFSLAEEELAELRTGARR